MKKELRDHVDRAWEAEMRAALGALAPSFDDWRSGKMSSADLNDAIHQYHNGPAREFAVEQPDQADGPSRHGPCLRKLRAGPARVLLPTFCGHA